LLIILFSELANGWCKGCGIRCGNLSPLQIARLWPNYAFLKT
jgi:hypothetical protein